MRRSLSEIIEERLAEMGAAGLLATCLPIITVGGAASVVVGDVALKAAALIVTLVFIAFTLAFLLHRNLTVRRENALYRFFVHKYCEVLFEQFPEPWRLTEWHHSVLLDHIGNVQQTIIVHGVARSKNLSFYKTTLHAAWPQSSRIKSRVAVQVRSLELEEIGGTRTKAIPLWLEDGDLRIVVPFPETIPRGAEFKIVCTLEWPMKSRPLVRGDEPEEFCFLLRKPLEKFNYTVMLPRAFKVSCDRVGFTPGDPGLSLTVDRKHPTHTTVTVQGDNLIKTGRVGMRLDVEPPHRKEK